MTPGDRHAVQGGVFAQRAHSAGTAPIITVIIQVTTLKTTCGIMHNQFKTQKFKHLMLAMGPRDLNSAPYSPVHCSSHSMTSFQPSELTELPVVENSQLFAQRAHSARYAPQYGNASDEKRFRRAAAGPVGGRVRYTGRYGMPWGRATFAQAVAEGFSMP